MPTDTAPAPFTITLAGDPAPAGSKPAGSNPAGSNPAGPGANGGSAADVGAAELAGLDALDAPVGARVTGRALWSATWPKLGAVALSVALWQLVVWTHWKPTYVLPGPATVGRTLVSMIGDGTLVKATVNTMVRAGIGFALALVIGVVVGSLVARSRVLRAAFGAMISGLQTMPSIAWFPLAILLFQLTEKAILFVVVLGAAPAIANGLITGADQIPPILLRAGRVLGARGLAAWWHVVLPASLPSFVGGLKQGWAFAWRSLMAGELIVIIAEKPSIGTVLQVSRTLADAPGLLATMVLILVLGIAVDSLVFSPLERMILRRWGLAETLSH